jgi:hypothetical protein
MVKSLLKICFCGVFARRHWAVFEDVSKTCGAYSGIDPGGARLGRVTCSRSGNRVSHGERSEMALTFYLECPIGVALLYRIPSLDVGT